MVTEVDAAATAVAASAASAGLLRENGPGGHLHEYGGWVELAHALWGGEAVRGGDHRALLGIGEEAHDVELRVRRGVEEDPAGYDWTSMGRIRVPADRADLVGCLPQRRFGPPWRPPWLTLVTAYSRRREQAFYNFTSPILQFRID